MQALAQHIRIAHADPRQRRAPGHAGPVETDHNGGAALAFLRPLPAAVFAQHQRVPFACQHELAQQDGELAEAAQHGALRHALVRQRREPGVVHQGRVPAEVGVAAALQLQEMMASPGLHLAGRGDMPLDGMGAETAAGDGHGIPLR